MSAAAGKKRASPGDDVPKTTELSIADEDVIRIEEAQKEVEKAELAFQLKSYKTMDAVFAKRRQVLKTIDNFWLTALQNSQLGLHIQHKEDQLAMSYLEDLWIARNDVEPRAFTIEFYFKENPFFSEKVLKKEFKYIPPPSGSGDVDENGLTAAHIDFAWERDVDAQSIKISWKSSAKNLTTLYPRVKDDEDDEEDALPADPGSFFNFFEEKEDIFEIGEQLASEIFPQAIDHFFGRVEGEDDADDSDEDSEDDDDDDDAEEIDLEKPRQKRAKH
jgi:template-activating factor I